MALLSLGSNSLLVAFSTCHRPVYGTWSKLVVQFSAKARSQPNDMDRYRIFKQ